MRGFPDVMFNADPAQVVSDGFSAGNGPIFLRNSKYRHKSSLLVLRLHHLSSADGFQQEFQNLDMTGRFGQILAPRIQPMPPNQEAMNVRICVQQVTDFGCKRFHVLTVFDNRQPLAMFMGLHPFEPLQHFVAFDKEASLPDVIVGKNRTPHGMCVQDCTGAHILNDREMQQCFGGWLALRRRYYFTSGIDFQNVFGRQAALIERTGRYRDAKRLALDHRAEISAGSQGPAPPLKLPSYYREMFRLRHDGEL